MSQIRSIRSPHLAADTSLLPQYRPARDGALSLGLAKAAALVMRAEKFC
jgi:hypothetical protein